MAYYIDPNINVAISGDATRLGQILVNLINNAIKFTASGGVTVSATLVGAASDVSPQRLRICVDDTGIGIANATQAKLLRRLHKRMALWRVGLVEQVLG